MIVEIPNSQLYTVWVDFKSGDIDIYNVECLTFNKQEAEKYMAEHIKFFPNRKYEMRVFNIGGIKDVSTSALRKEINRRKKEKQEEERREREMDEWLRRHPGVSLGGWGQVYYTKDWEGE